MKVETEDRAVLAARAAPVVTGATEDHRWDFARAAGLTGPLAIPGLTELAVKPVQKEAQGQCDLSCCLSQDERILARL